MRSISSRISVLAPVLGAVILLGSSDLAMGGGSGERSATRLRARSASRAKAAAKRIDRLVESTLKRKKLEPNPMLNDATFVRRAYLDIIGRIPTAEETAAFLAADSADKRSQLVDKLLDSPGYVSRMFPFWADLLRVKSRLGGQASGEPYIHFVKQFIDENRPYDQFVRDLLTADGPAHKRGNGATGYYLRDRGMPEDNMANTVRIFLGTRLECAQCHNHPFDKWKQKQFFAMAAFTGGIRYQDNMMSTTEGRRLTSIGNKIRKDYDRETFRTFGRLMRGVRAGISGSGTGVIKLPRDYKYDDGKPNELLRANVLFGKSPKLDYPKAERRSRKSRRNSRRRPNRNRRGRNTAAQIDSRKAYADWMTSPDNPRFTTVIANRLWKLVFGAGVIEPVDNMTDDTKPSDPRLMNYLEKLMRDVHYDVAQFLRVLYNTKLFNREASVYEPAPGENYYFQGPVLRRMSGEQIWDSLMTLVVDDLDSTIKKPGEAAERVYEQYEQFVNLPEDEIVDRVVKAAERYKNPQKYREEQRRLRAQQQQKRRKIQKLQRELGKVRRARDRARQRKIVAELEKLGVGQRNQTMSMRRRRAPQRGFVRAADLPSPAPPGHFLREFGQSDRETIEGAHTDANVPQVLSLMNGLVETVLLRRQSAALWRTLDKVQTDEDRVRMAYLSIFNRQPSPDELGKWLADALYEDPKQFFPDLVWTLLNSNEFRFIQ